MIDREKSTKANFFGCETMNPAVSTYSKMEDEI